MYYFVDKEHENNFYQLLTRYPIGQKDKEYQVGFYIVAVAEIYRHCNENPVSDNSSPFDWFFDEVGNPSQYCAGLSSGYLSLVKAGINLFNNYEDFTLYQALGTWGDQLYKVFIQACEIRRGRQIIRIA